MLSRVSIILSVLYFFVAIVLGNYMGIRQDFRLRHVHVHIAVLGWLSLAVIGLLYSAYPALQRGWRATAQMWLHNVGLVTFMGGFARYALTGEKILAPIAIGSLALSIGVLLLAIQVITTLWPTREVRSLTSETILSK
jgi:uncharacterized membrane protein YgdD (TMEM256/DUF423 family)